MLNVEYSMSNIDKWVVVVSFFLRSFRARISYLRDCKLLIHADRGESDSGHGILWSLERRHDDNCRCCSIGKTTWSVHDILVIPPYWISLITDRDTQFTLEYISEVRFPNRPAAMMVLLTLSSLPSRYCVWAIDWWRTHTVHNLALV